MPALPRIIAPFVHSAPLAKRAEIQAQDEDDDPVGGGVLTLDSHHGPRRLGARQPASHVPSRAAHGANQISVWRGAGGSKSRASRAGQAAALRSMCSESCRIGRRRRSAFPERGAPRTGGHYI